MGSLYLEVFKGCVDVVLGIRFSGEHGGAGLTAGLSDPGGIFQPYRF